MSCPHDINVNNQNAVEIKTRDTCLNHLNVMCLFYNNQRQVTGVKDQNAN